MTDIADRLRLYPNRLLDFGPPLEYPVLSKAFTVEKLTLWQFCDDKVLSFVLLRAHRMTRARVEGTMYSLTDEQVYELDNVMENGVKCDRVRIPVYVPVLDKEGNMDRLDAYAYIGRNSYWLDRIEYGANVPKQPTFTLVKREMHSQRILNGRFVFLPDPVNNHTERFVRPEIVQHISNRNAETVSRLNQLREEAEKEAQQQIIQAIEEARQQKRAQIRRSIANFFSDEI